MKLTASEAMCGFKSSYFHLLSKTVSSNCVASGGYEGSGHFES
jgi:hypothetical protein